MLQWEQTKFHRILRMISSSAVLLLYRDLIVNLYFWVSVDKLHRLYGGVIITIMFLKLCSHLAISPYSLWVWSAISEILEDWDLWLVAARLGEYIHVPDILDLNILDLCVISVMSLNFCLVVWVARSPIPDNSWIWSGTWLLIACTGNMLLCFLCYLYTARML